MGFLASLLTFIAAVATFMLTIEGVWIIWTARTPKNAKEVMTKGCPGQRKRICVIFATYKDTVNLGEWIKWGDGEPIKFIIAEDSSNNNDIYSDKATVIHRDTREGFKAGAVNNVFDMLAKGKEQFDYIMLFDADHVPYNRSIKEVYGYLNKDVIQFFWLDGLPLRGPVKGPLNWLCYSSRYYSDWNIYNRAFGNLVGSALAIDFKLIKNDNLRFPNSITEDYALTLYTARKKKLRVTVMPFVLSIGNAPKNFKAYVKQQIRWSEGTIRDAKTYFWSVVLNERIGLRGKLDFLFHVNLYLQGIWMCITVIAWASGVVAYSYLIIPILLFQTLAYFKTITKAPKRYWPIYFFLNYFMAVVQVYAFLRGWLIRKGSFYATEKAFGGTANRSGSNTSKELGL
jgi:cellulose synthase/poly-beta-1,6-N-acetylglucosamine synthase-like glycosyltransferase